MTYVLTTMRKNGNQVVYGFSDSYIPKSILSNPTGREVVLVFSEDFTPTVGSPISEAAYKQKAIAWQVESTPPESGELP